MHRIRYAVTVSLRHKGFLLLGATSIGLGISLCCIVFALFDAMLLPKMDIVEPLALRTVWYTGDFRRRLHATDFNQSIRSMRSLAGAAGSLAEAHQSVTRDVETRAVRVLRISSSYFDVLGVRPIHGRLLAHVDASNETRPVVLSERMWRQWIGGSGWRPGTTILLNQEPREVIGVVDLKSDLPGAYTDIWQLETADKPLWHNLVRVAHGTVDEQFAAELKVVAAQLAMKASEPSGSTWFTVRRLFGSPFRVLGFHVGLIAAVVAVFLVACSNIASLQLARGEARARELSILGALGATGMDLVVVSLAESAIVVLSGLVISAGLTVAGVELVKAATPPAIGAFLIQPQLSWRLMGFASLAAVVGVALVGLLPALSIGRSGISQSLKAGAHSLRQHVGWSRGLLVLQLGLALTVLVGAAALLRTVARIRAFDFGQGAERLVTATVLVSPRSQSDMRGVENVRAELLGASRSEELATSVAVRTFGWPVGRTISVAQQGKSAEDIGVGFWSYSEVSSDYLQTLGVPVLDGRNLREGATEEVVVDRATAAWLWPGASPIGNQIKLGESRSKAPWLTVVGVMGQVPAATRADIAEGGTQGIGTVLVTAPASSQRLRDRTTFNVLVRSATAAGVPELRGRLERAFRRMGPDVAVLSVAPYVTPRRLDVLYESQVFVAGVFTTFAFIALSLAGLGVYAAFSQRVSLRRKEFALRLCLGASPRQVRSPLLREANILVLSGVALGLAAAALTIDWLRAFVRSGADRYDPLLYAGVAMLTIAIATVAALLPLRKAVPENTLRVLNGD